MLQYGSRSILSCLLICASAIAVEAAGRHMMEPRVPADQLEAARTLKSPIPYSPETVEKGRGLYEGKGTCFNCHGLTGRGDGPGGAALDPPPRNFRHHGMWRHRSEGEIFWVIKHGSPGTGMIPFGGMLTDEEIWTVIQYEKTFSGRQGRQKMGPPEGRGPHRRGGMGRGGGRHGDRGGCGRMGEGSGRCGAQE